MPEASAKSPDVFQLFVSAAGFRNNSLMPFFASDAAKRHAHGVYLPMAAAFRLHFILTTQPAAVADLWRPGELKLAIEFPGPSLSADRSLAGRTLREMIRVLKPSLVLCTHRPWWDQAVRDLEDDLQRDGHDVTFCRPPAEAVHAQFLRSFRGDEADALHVWNGVWPYMVPHQYGVPNEQRELSLRDIVHLRPNGPNVAILHSEAVHDRNAHEHMQILYDSRRRIAEATTSNP